MVAERRVILDANILIRGIFGVRVRSLLEKYEGRIGFYSPDICVADAERYLPDISDRRGLDAAIGLAVLNQLLRLVHPVERSLYGDYEKVARARIATRDAEDWPVIAAALLLECPIWTEDRDFFRYRNCYLDERQN